MMQFEKKLCPTPISELKEDEIKKTLFDHWSNAIALLVAPCKKSLIK